ncbi:RNA-binding S4 domain-containing protein [Phaeovulum vinaykumarii]
MSRRRPPPSSADTDGADADGATDRLRLDKWLWMARMARTRALAAELIGAGRVRVNGQPCRRPGRAVGPGDVLIFPQGRRLRVLRVLGVPQRRGPAPEARGFYEDLDPPPAPTDPAPSDPVPDEGRAASAGAPRAALSATPWPDRDVS